jgi:uncharacterized protein
MEYNAPDEPTSFTPVSRLYGWVIMVRSLIVAIPISIGAFVLDTYLTEDGLISSGLIIGPILFLLALFVVFRPFRIWSRIGYRLSGDQIQVQRGNVWRVDTIMPFSRVQHIDIAQGPLERMFGLASLVMHSAGTHNSVVTLPGLTRTDAQDLRDHIRAEIHEGSA